MSILSNRRVFGRALVSALACAVSVGLLALWETGHGAVLSARADTSAPEFAYSGDNGPGFWGETPGWEACAGTSRTERQSPIDINHIIFDRHLGALPLRLHETPLDLTNNGHTIEEEYEPGSSLTVNGVVYGLSQFHFHTLSEHTVTGRHAAMELHAVFADPASDNKAVVGQLFVIGKANHFIDELLTHGLPTKSGDEVNDPAQLINVAGALTNTARVLHVSGIADDAAVYRDGDVVRAPRVRAGVQRAARRVPPHPRQRFPADPEAERAHDSQHRGRRRRAMNP